MSEHENQTSTQIVAPIPPKEESGWMYVAIAAILICVAAMVYVWKTGSYSGQSKSQFSGVVYMDMGGIISSATKKYLDAPKKEGDDPAVSGKQFSANLQVILDEYKSAGVLVIDRRFVLAAPDGYDITNEVAGKLGLVLEK